MIKSILLALAASVTLTSVAHADGAYRVRYSSSYAGWDHGFHKTYPGFRESDPDRGCNGYSTCFYRPSGIIYQPADRVYVSETFVGSGHRYHEVVVYTDPGYTQEYCHYFVTDDGVVVEREYVVTYVPSLFAAPFLLSSVIMNDGANFDSDLKQLNDVAAVGAGIGLEITEIGALSGNKDTTEIGLAVTAGSLASASSASAEQAARDKQRTTALQLNIQDAEKSQTAAQGDIQ